MSIKETPTKLSLLVACYLTLWCFLTRKAKEGDLRKIIRFLSRTDPNPSLRLWTPQTLGEFAHDLQNTISPQTGQPYKRNTIRRILYTIKGFDRWLQSTLPDFSPSSPKLSRAIAAYLNTCEATVSANTLIAKRQDLAMFSLFYTGRVRGNSVQFWTSEVTRAFQKHLQTCPSRVTKRHYKATSINRIMATVTHFARWIDAQGWLSQDTGPPIQGVARLSIDPPVCRAPSEKQIRLLLRTCLERFHRLKNSKRHNPSLELAVVYVLLWTGLRVCELVGLNMHQYTGDGFCNVLRKGGYVTEFVPLPAEARMALELYLRENGRSDGPVFRSRLGGRVSVSRVRQILVVLSQKSSVHLGPREKFHVTPHMLRHLCVKRATWEGGFLYGYFVSGNKGFPEVGLYAGVSDLAMKEIMKQLRLDYRIGTDVSIRKRSIFLKQRAFFCQKGEPLGSWLERRAA